MNSVLLEHPAPAALPVARRVAADAVRRPPRRGRPGLGPLALGISVLVHVLIFALVRFDITVGHTDTSAAVRVLPADAMRATQVQNIVEVAGDVAPAVTAVTPAPANRITPPVFAPPAINAPRPTAPTQGPISSYREHIGPRMVAPEVWAAPNPLGAPLDEHQVAMDRIAERIGAMNDSAAAEADAARRAVDWTKKDGKGGRWGISPDGIHLGGITLPPGLFTPPPGRRAELDGRRRDWGEIQTQGGIQEGKESFEDRVRAIRERKEKERAEKPPV